MARARGREEIRRGANMVKPSVEPSVLQPGKRSSEVLEFEAKLHSMIIGQDESVTELVNIYQAVLAGMAAPGRPIANLLLLGPTGSGKTRLVEAAAEILFSTPEAVTKVDCGEFQHTHEIAKLIGAPPGYVGHRETPAILNQEVLDRFHTDKLKVSFLLFDEIEKASDALWQLLLGILDKGVLTLGDNRKVNLSRTIIFMTSNLGASEMTRLMTGGIGFAPAPRNSQSAQLERKIHRVAVDAARRRFSPEFMNRIDKALVFGALRKPQLQKILEIELVSIQTRIFITQADRPFALIYTNKAKELLLAEGTDLKNGARHLKRAIERYLVLPLSSLLATGQIFPGDTITVDMDVASKELKFSRANLAFRSV